MKFQYFDIHGHMNFPAYDADRDEVAKRAVDSGVGMITVGTDLVNSKSAVELAEKNEGMWATVGMHPTERIAFDYEAFKELALHPKVVAIGECGLDYFHSKPEEMETQRGIFIEHIKLARETGKPLMLHVRNSKNAGPSAYLEAVKILKENSAPKANFHFFAGSLDDAKAAIDAGCTLSFTGVITFARNYDEVIKYVPFQSIMSETDCPYVSPAPYRGKRNEPSYVIEVVKKIAEIRNQPENEVASRLTDNVRSFFGLL